MYFRLKYAVFAIYFKTMVCSIPSSYSSTIDKREWFRYKCSTNFSRGTGVLRSKLL